VCLSHQHTKYAGTSVGLAAPAGDRVGVSHAAACADPNDMLDLAVVTRLRSCGRNEKGVEMPPIERSMGKTSTTKRGDRGRSAESTVQSERLANAGSAGLWWAVSGTAMTPANASPALHGSYRGSLSLLTAKSPPHSQRTLHK